MDRILHWWSWCITHPTAGLLLPSHLGGRVQVYCAKITSCTRKEAYVVCRIKLCPCRGCWAPYISRSCCRVSTLHDAPSTASSLVLVWSQVCLESVNPAVHALLERGHLVLSKVGAGCLDRARWRLPSVQMPVLCGGPFHVQHLCCCVVCGAEIAAKLLDELFICVLMHGVLHGVRIV